MITDIYSAGETNINGTSGKVLATEIAKHHDRVVYHDDLATLDKFLNSEILRSGDLAMFLGAGNLNQIIPKAIEIINDER